MGANRKNTKASALAEGSGDRLRRTADPDAMSVELVSAYAGDRDRILIELARTMTEQVRDSDICCRFGGEEFVAILPFTSSPGEAREIAERIREKATTIMCGGGGITISAGVAVCDSGIRSPRELIESADRALYRAKRNGKNQVALAPGHE